MCGPQVVSIQQGNGQFYSVRNASIASTRAARRDGNQQATRAAVSRTVTPATSVTGSRGLIAASLMLDIVVDDTPENCMDVASDSRARTIAIFRNRQTLPPSTLDRMGIKVVESTGQCLDLLAEIDSSLARQQTSRFERVMQKLGLREPTSA